MARPQVVGAPDTGGMGHAQDKDPNAARGMQQAEARRRTADAEEAKPGAWQRGKEWLFGKKVPPVAGVASQVSRDIDGAFLTTFNDAVREALRGGSVRTNLTRDEQMLRQVICSEQFIKAIEDVAVRAPFEENARTRAAKQINAEREELAGKLRRIQPDPKTFTDPTDFIDLTSVDLDIIYSTMAGPPESEHRPDAKKRKGLGAIAYWQKSEWPEGLPKPPEALLTFLDSVVVHKYPTEMGRAKGTILADLASRSSTIDKTEGLGNPNRSLIDSNYIRHALYERASGPVQETVEAFRGLVRTLLGTPTENNCQGIPVEEHVSGLGYAQYCHQIFDGLTTAKTAAEAKATTAASEYWAVAGPKEKAKQECAKAKEALKEAEAMVSVLTNIGNETPTPVREDDGSATIVNGKNDFRYRAYLQKAIIDAETARNALSAVENARDAIDKQVKTKRDAVEAAHSELGEAKKGLVGATRGGNPTEIQAEQAKVTAAEHKVEITENDYLTYAGPTELAGFKCSKAQDALKEATKTFSLFLDAKKTKPFSFEDDDGSAVTINGRNDPGYGAYLRLSRAQLQKARLELVAAEQAKEKVDAEVNAKKRAMETTALELRKADENLERYNSIESPRAVEDKLVHIFRAQLEMASGSGAPSQPEQIGDVIADHSPNMVLDKLLEQAKRNLELMQRVVQISETAALSDERRNSLMGVLSIVKEADLEKIPALSHLTTRLAADVMAPATPLTHQTERAEFDREMKKFKTAIDGAQLPEETKIQLRTIHERMAALMPVSDGQITEMIERTRKEYGRPLRQVVKFAVRSISTQDGIASLTKTADLDAWMTFKKRPQKVEDPGLKQEGWLAKAWGVIGYYVSRRFLFHDRALMRAVHFLTISAFEDLRHFWDPVFGKDPRGKEYPTYLPLVGALEKDWLRMRQGYYGLLKLAFITYPIASLIVGGFISQGGPRTSDWNLPGRFMNLVHAEDAVYLSGRHWYDSHSALSPLVPYTYVMRTEAERQHPMLVLGDSVSDPLKLTKRPDRYYTKAYGVTGQARLDWLRRHPDVLVYLQELVDGRQKVIVHPLELVEARNNGTCSWTLADGEGVKTEIFPPSCVGITIRHPDGTKTVEGGLGVTDDASAVAYARTKMVDVDWRGWRADLDDAVVCCTAQIDSDPVEHGLTLNRAEGNQVIDELMAAEGQTKGRKIVVIDRGYMDRRRADTPERNQWEHRWYLITHRTKQMTEDYRITQRPNVEFMMTQGDAASALIVPLCNDEPVSRELLVPWHRDEFVAAWRQKIVDIYAARVPAITFDPVRQAVSTTRVDETGNEVPDVDETGRTVLEQAFDEVMEAHGLGVLKTHRSECWVRDRTHEYETKQIADQVGSIGIRAEDVLHTLVREAVHAEDGTLQPGPIMTVLLRYRLRESPYSIVRVRADGFAREIASHKSSGGNVMDYDPLVTPPDEIELLVPVSSKLQSAVNNGFVVSRDTLHASAVGQEGGVSAGAAEAEGQQVQPIEEDTETPSGAAPPITTPAPIMGPEARAVFASEPNRDFVGIFDATLESIFAPNESNHELVQRVLDRRFDGNRARMESALKQEFYTHALSPTARDPNRLDPMVAAMTRARISFDGAGAGTEITTADQRLAADALNRQVMTLIRAWDRQ